MVAEVEGFFAVAVEAGVFVDGAAEVACGWGGGESNLSGRAVGGEGGFRAYVDGGLFALYCSVDGVGLDVDFVGDEAKGLFGGDGDGV